MGDIVDATSGAVLLAGPMVLEKESSPGGNSSVWSGFTELESGDIRYYRLVLLGEVAPFLNGEGAAYCATLSVKTQKAAPDFYFYDFYDMAIRALVAGYVDAPYSAADPTSFSTTPSYEAPATYGTTITKVDCP